MASLGWLLNLNWAGSEAPLVPTPEIINIDDASIIAYGGDLVSIMAEDGDLVSIEAE